MYAPEQYIWILLCITFCSAFLLQCHHEKPCLLFVVFLYWRIWKESSFMCLPATLKFPKGSSYSSRLWIKLAHTTRQERMQGERNASADFRFLTADMTGYLWNYLWVLWEASPHLWVVGHGELFPNQVQHTRVGVQINNTVDSKLSQERLERRGKTWLVWTDNQEMTFIGGELFACSRV